MWNRIAVHKRMNHRISNRYERIRNQITLDVITCLMEYVGLMMMMIMMIIIRIIIIYLLQLGCYPVAVVILHVNKT